MLNLWGSIIAKDFILEEEFCKFYSDLDRNDEDKVKEHMKILKDREEIKKCSETIGVEIIGRENLPRFILGNDKDFDSFYH